MQHNVKRRHFLQWGAAGVGAALAGINARAADVCIETARQTSGPFYPGQGSFAMDNDLTAVPGAKAAPLGEVIYIKGIVRDADCRPVAGVNVEIWQACASGKYNNASDPNPAPLDPNFKYWGETISNANGEYSFKSILPGAYPAAADWDRPPHIHFRLMKRGYHELITQMYFKGDPLNETDKILVNVPRHLRGEVIVDFQPTVNEPTTKTGVFNITILKV